MPTNLPDPRKRKTQENNRENREAFLKVLFGVVRIALMLAVAMIIWSFFANI